MKAESSKQGQRGDEAIPSPHPDARPRRTSVVAVDLGVIAYREALALQREAVARLQRGSRSEVLFLLEHPHVITLGRSTRPDSMLATPPPEVEVIACDRGGAATYHGPGQLVAYPILKLEEEYRNIVRHVSNLEEVLIRALAAFSIEAHRRPQFRGVWVGEAKIASLGVRISRWVTSHGFALNVSTDLSYFSLIHPCGIPGCRLTSMEKLLGKAPPLPSVKEQIVRAFGEVFQCRVRWKAYPIQRGFGPFPEGKTNSPPSP